MIFCDFLLRISQRKDIIGAVGASPLGAKAWPLSSWRPGRIILQLDDGAGRLSERVELRTFGRRIPFGLSGPGSQEHSESWFHWAHGRFRQDFRMSSALRAIFL